MWIKYKLTEFVFLMSISMVASATNELPYRATSVASYHSGFVRIYAPGKYENSDFGANQVVILPVKNITYIKTLLRLSQGCIIGYSIGEYIGRILIMKQSCIGHAGVMDAIKHSK